MRTRIIATIGLVAVGTMMLAPLAMATPSSPAPANASDGDPGCCPHLEPPIRKGGAGGGKGMCGVLAPPPGDSPRPCKPLLP